MSNCCRYAKRREFSRLSRKRSNLDITSRLHSFALPLPYVSIPVLAGYWWPKVRSWWVLFPRICATYVLTHSSKLIIWLGHFPFFATASRKVLYLPKHKPKGFLFKADIFSTAFDWSHINACATECFIINLLDICNRFIICSAFWLCGIACWAGNCFFFMKPQMLINFRRLDDIVWPRTPSRCIICVSSWLSVQRIWVSHFLLSCYSSRDMDFNTVVENGRYWKVWLNGVAGTLKPAHYRNSSLVFVYSFCLQVVDIDGDTFRSHYKSGSMVSGW